MSPTAVFWLGLALIAAGTFVLRGAFILFAHRLPPLRPAAVEALRMLPPAVLAALVVPALIVVDGTFEPAPHRLGAGLVALLVAWRTRSLLATLAVGLAAAVVLERLF